MRLLWLFAVIWLTGVGALVMFTWTVNVWVESDEPRLGNQRELDRLRIRRLVNMVAWFALALVVWESW